MPLLFICLKPNGKIALIGVIFCIKILAQYLLPLRSTKHNKMTPFLQQIVNDIDLNGQDPCSLKDHCYVFPTRRASVYFKKYLAQRFEGQYFWSPVVCSVVEFIELLTQKVILNPVTLVFELYAIYKNYEPEVKFDTFYPWGQIILKDFDDIDKYMVDAQKLFTNLKDIKSIEEHFALPNEQLQFLKQFWNVLDKPQLSETEQEFIKIWEVLGKVYTDFQVTLSLNQAAYEGMAQRQVLEQLQNGSLKLPYTHIVWAGFNALTTAETGIVEHLCEHYNTTVYWDTDAYYMHPKSRQEAGRFMRRYYERWHNPPCHNWSSQTQFTQNPLHIHLIGVPLRVGQAKYTGQMLETLLQEQQIDATNTAVVLGDEGLLFPALYSLPPSVDAVNITMGYPLRDTPLYRLLETLVQLQKTAQIPHAKPNQPTAQPPKPDDDEDPDAAPLQEPPNEQQTIYQQEQVALFYSKFIIQLLQNPFIKQFAPTQADDLIAYLTKYNIVYTYNYNIAQKLQHPVFTTLFARANTFLDLITLFSNVLNTLFYDAKQRQKQQHHTPDAAEPDDDPNFKPDEVQPHEEPVAASGQFMEMEFIYHLLRHLRLLSETLHKYRQNITIDTFWKIFREVVQTVTLPFSGEPLRGLQIMGFLETRTLDFDNLFVLGLNEGIIPATKPHLTFIPFNLRKGFGLPTFLDQDAIFAYHFYHLLQRAKNVYLLYNTEAGTTGGNEKSRFLLQLEQELKALPHTNVTLSQSLVSTPLSNNAKRKPVVIQKTPDVLNKLHRYLKPLPPAHLNEPTQAKLSPTALSTYINCPAQFYFKYIANLYELQNLDEEINNLLFGNILHRTIELLYEPYINQLITAAIIDQLLNNNRLISKKLNQAFTDNHFEHHKEGKNLLLKRVIKRLVVKVLENDKTDAPFKIVGLETREYTTTLPLTNGQEVVISGSIDRVDEVFLPDGSTAYRIIDYKTGNVKLQTPTALKKDLPDYLNAYFIQPDYKTGFQTYLYSYLFWVHHHKNIALKAGLYALKQLSGGIRYLRQGEILSAELLAEFEKQLCLLLNQIFDPNTPFTQTPLPERYTYSPYQGLVGF